MSAIKRPNDMLKGKRNEILAVLYKLHSRGGGGGGGASGVGMKDLVMAMECNGWKRCFHQPALVKIFVGSLKILEDLHEDPSADL